MGNSNSHPRNHNYCEDLEDGQDKQQRVDRKPLSDERDDVQRRIADFQLLMKNEKVERDDNARILLLVISWPPLAWIVSIIILNVRSALQWVAEAEKRLKIRLPPSQVEMAWKNLPRKEDECPADFVFSLGILILVIFLIDMAVCGLEAKSTDLQSQMMLQLLEKDTQKLLTNREWHRLLTCTLVHESSWRAAVNVVCIFWCGCDLEARHGSIKTANFILLGTYGASLLHFTLASDLSHVGAESICFVMTGIIYADIAINLDSLLFGARIGNCHYIFALALLFANLYLWPFWPLTFWIDPGVSAPSLLYGFCLAIPFIDHMQSSNVLRDSVEVQTRRRWLPALRWACFIPALLSMLLCHGLLLSGKSYPTFSTALSSLFAMCGL